MTIFRQVFTCLLRFCRPFRTESQPDTALSGGWAGSSSSRYFAGGNPGRPLEADALSLQPGSRPLAAHRTQLCRDAADLEPTTPCRPEALTRQRSLLGPTSAAAAALQMPSSTVQIVRDQHVNQLEACVVKQVRLALPNLKLHARYKHGMHKLSAVCSQCDLAIQTLKILPVRLMSPVCKRQCCCDMVACSEASRG